MANEIETIDDRGTARQQLDEEEISRVVRLLIAYHEAGHAVVALLLGLVIIEIDMAPNEDYRAKVVAVTAGAAAEQAGGDEAAIARGVYKDLMVALAGAAAQKLAGCPELPDEDPDEDVDNIGHYASLLACAEVMKAGPPAMPGPGEEDPLQAAMRAAALGIIARAEAETVAMLKDNWPAVARVAGVLAERDRLTRAELDDIIAND